MTHSGYLGTLLRYGCCAVAIGLAMMLVYRLLRRCRASEQTAAGYAFIFPWLIGFAIFWIGPILLSLYLSGSRYDVHSPPQ